MTDVISDVCSAAAMEILETIATSTKVSLGDTVRDVFGGLIGDRIHYWRQRNLVDTLETTARYIRGKGVDLATARVLPNGELYAIFDGASKADEPEVQKMWASLLASSLDPNGAHGETKKFSATLEQLNGSEARLLTFLNYASKWENEFRSLRRLRSPILDPDGTRKADIRIEAHLEILQKKLSAICGDQAEGDLRAIANLQRLGCVSRRFDAANAGDVLESVGVMGTSRTDGELYMVNPIKFERLIDEIIVHAAISSGQHGEFEDKRVVDAENSNRPVLYSLTDYGSRLVQACGGGDDGHPRAP